MQNRLAATLVALTVIVASGTAPALVSTPDIGAVVWEVQPSLVESVDSAQVQQAKDAAIDDAIVDRQAQVAGLAEVARAAEAASVAEAARSAEAEQVQADQVAEAARAAAAQAAETISQVQQTLLSLGYSGVGAVDALAGPHTTSAVEAFQADAGYPVTGEASTATLAQLVEKSDAGWHRPAPVAKTVVPRRAATPAAPAQAALAPAAAAAAPAWTTYVANSGGQATIDLCAGGLTAFRGDDGHAFFSVPYLTIHNNCGGAPILKLSTGDTVVITGGGVDGTYQVVDSRDVSQGSTTDAVEGVAGDILLQTCYFNSTTMRVVGATKVS
ncbi:Putative peptidoglycan binding domain-containing protein [Sanguibacter gelidistatuariae]|uniref:Putative peptidoglycan binding domain-containing protein n=1 Tax=Sanguibacter gelidistatuariae TaxID=1814289 RepID=A0A1G6TMF5_9MICO|nr:peptidoglycan-binding protein [Sanguibacter gelidistatuariae]SDD29686.1 Putative peptidoglycan binding domain-containing protein [Sanguibacter gelidistatuariae]